MLAVSTASHEAVLYSALVYRKPMIQSLIPRGLILTETMASHFLIWFKEPNNIPC